MHIHARVQAAAFANDNLSSNASLRRGAEPSALARWVQGWCICALARAIPAGLPEYCAAAAGRVGGTVRQYGLFRCQVRGKLKQAPASRPQAQAHLPSSSPKPSRHRPNKRRRRARSKPTMVVVSPYWLLSCWDAQRLLPLAATKPTQVRDWLDTYNVAHLEDGARLRLEPSQRLLFQPGLLSEPPLRGKVVAVTGFRRPSERGKGPCVDQIHCLIDMLGGCFMSALDLYGGVSRTACVPP